MAHALNKLTARQVASIKKPGRYADGGGLYFRITNAGSKSWVFMVTQGGKRIEIGLGRVIDRPLAAARQLAQQMREAMAEGKDPRSVLADALPAQPAEPAPTPLTFGEFADQYIASVEDGWKSPIHRQQWRSSLRDHAASLLAKPLADISTDDVLAVLEPIWLTKAETAKRVRGRIEKVLAAAMARKLRPRDATNPAAWRGHLQVLLPSQAKVARHHHAALAYHDAPAFMAQLRNRTALAARCLEFTILTAARSGEALGATWGEIDIENKLWVVPGERMKAGAEHIVPLSDAAMAVLDRLPAGNRKRTDPVFGVAGAARSNMAMAMLLRRMGHGDITTHGFRSTFRDWAGDRTDFPREIIEQALAHTIQNKAERAYRRGSAVDRRRHLMAAWSTYLHNSA
ncbi:integrase [Sphingomonas yabuuchiae]|uniref:Integrase n=1 Tax=Sphingomonas yabuuchiae TaxID=172044 RepID=A0A147IS55_9SPHN|nr:integrase [Sphingomonas yabuuchiae]